MSNQKPETRPELSYQKPEPQLPQVGKWRDKEFAAAFDRSVETIRDWLSRYGIPHHPLGRDVVIDAEVFWQHAPWEMFEDGEQTEETGKGG